MSLPKGALGLYFRGDFLAGGGTSKGHCRREGEKEEGKEAGDLHVEWRAGEFEGKNDL